MDDFDIIINNKIVSLQKLRTKFKSLKKASSENERAKLFQNIHPYSILSTFDLQ
jgi:hypothetical protein